MLWGGVQEATVAPLSSCVLPKDVTGPIAIFVTSEQTPLVADVVKQNKEIIVAGPAYVFRSFMMFVLPLTKMSIAWSLSMT